MSESALQMNGEVGPCHIDLGRELSIMHGILKEHIHKISNVRRLPGVHLLVSLCIVYVIGCHGSVTKLVQNTGRY